MTMKKALIFLHKWLGIALALFFIMWFASGVVLYFVPFPSLTQAERLGALPPLRLPAGCCLTAEQAAHRAGLGFTEARLGMHGDVPVWRLLVAHAGPPAHAPHWRALDARSGEVIAPLSEMEAARVAETFSARHARSAELLERDQWTVPQGLDPYRPLVKVRLDGRDGLELYVSAGAAEVVRDTRRGERFWNWLGAVPHWLYPTALRQFPRAWHHVVVWIAIPGVLLAATGLVLGVWQLFLNPSRWIPYRKFWWRWHHIAGLVAAVFTLTWISSGLLSMNPFGVFSPRVSTAAERMQWRGTPAQAKLDIAAALAQAQAQGLATRELERFNLAGQAWYRLHGADRQLLVRADIDASIPQVKAVAALPDDLVVATLAGLRKEAGLPAVRRIAAYDSLYYARDPTGPNARDQRPLPAWRADWADGTTLYVDPASARMLLRVDGAGRWQRILYSGLHSFDFAPLLARPWLRHALVVGLSMLGLVLCITSCVIAWRALGAFSRRRPRLAPSRPCAVAAPGRRARCAARR